MNSLGSEAIFLLWQKEIIFYITWWHQYHLPLHHLLQFQTVFLLFQHPHRWVIHTYVLKKWFTVCNLYIRLCLPCSTLLGGSSQSVFLPPPPSSWWWWPLPLIIMEWQWHGLEWMDGQACSKCVLDDNNLFLFLSSQAYEYEAISPWCACMYSLYIYTF